jgi:parvulin-like peptidyl-prolyl isomerase
MKTPMKSRSRSTYLNLPVSVLAAVFFILLTHTPSEGQQVHPGGTPGDGLGSADSNIPVAKVNGVTIFQSDLSCAVEASLVRKLSSRRGSRGKEQTGSKSDLVDNKKTLNRLVEIELLYQESLKHRFHGLAEESEERYKAEVKRLGGEDQLASALQCNNMSPEQFRKSIFRNLSIKRLLDKAVYSKIKVKDDEIREYYESNKSRFRKPESIRISQILVKAPTEPGEEKWRHAEARALTIYQDASRGADFVRLARRHSDDPATASAGGDMGTIQKDGKKGIFDTTIFNMTPGSVTKPIRSRQGFHIVKVTSTTPSSPKSLEEVRQHITTRLRRGRSREMIASLIDDLRSKAEIEIIDTSTR